MKWLRITKLCKETSSHVNSEYLQVTQVAEQKKKKIIVLDIVCFC